MRSTSDRRPASPLAAGTAPVPSESGEASSGEFARPGSDLRVMTFNIRYGTAKDGENHWKHRCELVAQTIRDQAPHVFGIQEGLDFQMDFLAEHCPGYTPYGQHNDGDRRGEFSGLLIDGERLEVVDWGQFWLSPTPKKVASKGWDAVQPRTAVWVRLRERAAADGGQDFVALGTHFDHRGTQAREESARLLVSRMDEVRGAQRLPVILMGDFNAGPESAPMAVFGQAGYVNALLALHPEESGAGTSHRFEGHHTGGMIDLIWVTHGWTPTEAVILRPRSGARCASDHDPVLVGLPARG